MYVSGIEQKPKRDS